MAAHFYYQHSCLRDGNVSGFGLSMNFFVEASYPYKYAIYLIWSAVRRDSDVVLGEFSLVYIRSSFLMNRPVVPQNSWLMLSQPFDRTCSRDFWVTTRGLNAFATGPLVIETVLWGKSFISNCCSPSSLRLSINS